jgi:hypothetical protein
MKHKLMKAMRVREDTRELDGCVEIDDAYFGCEGQASRLKAYSCRMNRTDPGHVAVPQ